MTKLTTDIKKQITKDWQNMFPEMGIYKPMWLLKRAGPVLFGVCLERTTGNDVYRPLAHVHNLCCPSPTIAFSLIQRLKGRKGADESIPVLAHEERYKDAAKRLEEQTLIPLRKDIDFVSIISTYNSYIQLEESTKFPTRFTPQRLAFEDILLLNTWAGKPYEETKKILDSYRSEMVKWPPRTLIMLGDENGLQGWYERMDAIIKDRDKILSTVEEEIVKHKLEKIPYKELKV